MMSSLFKTLITPFIGIMTNAHKNSLSMPDAVDSTAQAQPQKMPEASNARAFFGAWRFGIGAVCRILGNSLCEL